jgi:Mlc titration factor MtfA (ptsG expression regulator)
VISRKRHGQNEPIPEPWRAILAERLSGWAAVGGPDRSKLESMVATFVGQKRWEGAGGLTVTDEMRVVVAAYACLLVLRLDLGVFRSVGSIVLYPGPVVTHAVRSLGGGIMSDGPLPIHGETRQGGPVVIVWSAADRESLHPELGRNVVIHEFAHQLDLHDGALDGTPPLRSRELRERWSVARDAVYAQVLAHGDPLLGSYAATNHGELFAVSTERFFTKSLELRALHPGWYEMLAAAYGQDPAGREDRAGR